MTTTDIDRWRAAVHAGVDAMFDFLGASAPERIDPAAATADLLIGAQGGARWAQLLRALAGREPGMHAIADLAAEIGADPHGLDTSIGVAAKGVGGYAALPLVRSADWSAIGVADDVRAALRAEYGIDDDEGELFGEVGRAADAAVPS